jgi:UDP-GlcNAc:undecaprenyl-phosphate/decaprenyl-phosphate GlcNAc-1-phosphate transferase
VNALVIAFASLAVALVATPLAISVARRTGIMDRPGDLKTQTVPVPYLGGVAVFLGTAVGVLSGRPSVLVPLAAALALGVGDDRFELPAFARLIGEVGIGLVVVVTCPVRFPGLVGGASIVAVTVLLINGVNLLDGLDMLAGGVVAVAAFGFAAVLDGSGRQLAMALGGALVGFLVFNRFPARIYLGDGGSYLLGTASAVLLAETWAPHAPLPAGMAALALVAIPAAEVAFAVVRRLRGRRSLMVGDRGHPYDRLVNRGWPPISVTMAYIVAEALLAVAAVIVVHRSTLAGAVLIDAVGAGLLISAAAAVGAISPDQEARS